MFYDIFDFIFQSVIELFAKKRTKEKEEIYKTVRGCDLPLLLSSDGRCTPGEFLSKFDKP